MKIEVLFRQFVYWGVWLIIPILWELFMGFAGSLLVIIKYILRKPEKDIDFYPMVTVLIPVYNSQKTLEMCLESIVKQDYPTDKIEIFLIDNGPSDDSYNIFIKFQKEYPQLKIWWYTSSQGKSKALNKGIFASMGKYVINIDSDGILDPSAIKNVVKRFENNKKVNSLTGVILTNPELIDNTESDFLKTIQLCELFEYAESFFVGRNVQAVFNTMYTLAGAFSAFRREALLKTQMYNSETLGEDTHMTFQIKNFAGGKVDFCEKAFFLVDPIESLNRIYIQRQRWQRAELEVARLFVDQHIGGIFDFITKSPVRKMVSDHTLMFPRLIWFFAMIYLYFINYPMELIVGANVLMYAAYLFNSIIYIFASTLYLKNQAEIKNYILKHWYIIFILPFYRFILYWIRIAGVINSIKTDSKWNTKTFSEEIGQVSSGITRGIKKMMPFIGIVKRYISREQDSQS
ncbi:MAG TPA: putative glycosyltransferase, exosortase G system-associated [Clostridiaceae bacterium]|nr:putative glycosyltransferase, exosortase G system-associated [Clostridiaceae bacterium]